jgi:hypothetical protein
MARQSPCSMAAKELNRTRRSFRLSAAVMLVYLQAAAREFSAGDHNREVLAIGRPPLRSGQRFTL